MSSSFFIDHKFVTPWYFKTREEAQGLLTNLRDVFSSSTAMLEAKVEPSDRQPTKVLQGGWLRSVEAA